MAQHSDTRYIESGSCTWCGHPPHPDVCPNKIRTDRKGTKDVMTPCPCVKHEWKQ